MKPPLRASGPGRERHGRLLKSALLITAIAAAAAVLPDAGGAPKSNKAIPKVVKRTKAPPPPAPPQKRKKAEKKLIWDHWYTVTLDARTPYAYYNEKAYIQGERLHSLTKMWKQEEGFINEEHYGGFSLNTLDLQPLFFNFHSTYRSTETRIDGTVSHGKSLSVRVHKGNTDLPVVRRRLPDGTFFSQFFNLWLGKNLARIKSRKRIRFKTILEENLENNFKVVTGTVKLGKPDEFAKVTKSTRIGVKFKNVNMTYWVRNNGAPVRIVMPKIKGVHKMVRKEEAEKFFSEF